MTNDQPVSQINQSRYIATIFCFISPFKNWMLPVLPVIQLPIRVFDSTLILLTEASMQPAIAHRKVMIQELRHQLRYSQPGEEQAAIRSRLQFWLTYTL